MTDLIKGKYLLERCIGRGGMAEVFAGRAVGAAGFSQRVAIKRILPVHGRDAGFREMFVAEAQLSALLRHPNIVRVSDFDEDEAGCLFLVMEYVDGVDLDGLVRTGLLPLPAILFVTAEILRGLAHAHELPFVEGGPRGLVHRDVSPQNVLLSWDGAVLVSDFGIAKARMATQAGVSFLIKGKPAYMSPEQAGGLALDGRSDVFAVGIMLWEMLCGEALFHDPDDMRATLAAVMFGDAPWPSSRTRRPIPDDIARATMRMLRRDREERPDAAGALAALTACADYPRSGREALAALLPERLPERAPRRGPPRLAETIRQRPAGAAPYATPIAVPADRRPARLRRDRGSVMARARRRGLRGVLLGAIAIGALTIGGLYVALQGTSSAALGAPAREPARLDALEPAGAPEVPRPAPAPVSGPGSTHAALQVLGVDVPQPDGAATHLPAPAPARTEPPGRGDANRTTPKPRAPAPASARPPAGDGMQIIDLRPETSELGRAPRGALELELGPARE